MKTLQEIPNYEPFITSISVMSKKDCTWCQVSALSVEEAKLLKSIRETKISQKTGKTGRLAQTAQVPQRNNEKETICLDKQLVTLVKKGTWQKIAILVSEI